MYPLPSTYEAIAQVSETAAARTLKRLHRQQAKGKKDDFVIAGSSVNLPLTTVSGIKINEASALRFSAVFAAIKVLAESVASLPLFFYLRTDQGKQVARMHRLFTLLHDLPNPEITSCEFRETMMAHLLLWGNGFAEIERNPGDGTIVALWPIHPMRVTVKRPDSQGPLVYVIAVPNGGGPVTLGRDQMFHIRGLSLDGVQGLSPIAAHREAVGLGLAAAEFGARFFSQGMTATGVLEHPNALGDTAYKRLQESIEVRNAGLSQAHRMMILEEGMKFQKLTIPPNEAQWLESRKFQVTEIARIYRIPPHMIGDLERATFSNIEELAIEFVSYSLRPWLVRWEQSISRDLLTERERQEFFAEFKMEGMLRGKTVERFSSYAVGRQWGWYTANEIRDLEGLNDIGPPGDIYLSPMNMLTAEQAAELAKENPEVELEQGKAGWLIRHRREQPEPNGFDHHANGNGVP